MKYLVNRETKDHRLWDGLQSAGPWKIVEADDEGWIKWEGGECPLRSFKHVEFRCINDSYASVAEAGNLRWELEGIASDIGSYRPILPAESKPDPCTKIKRFATVTDGGSAFIADFDTRHASANVFDRLSAAVSASEQIPALIAEINAMLPDGYEICEKAKPEAVTADDATGWKEGDALECLINNVSWWVGGKIYEVLNDGRGLYITDEDGDKRRLENIRQRFKFHSHPVTK